MSEIWKEIEGYPSYMVSNMGRVKSLNYRNTGKEGIMSPRISGNGHLKVTLRNIDGLKDYLVHRLVATHFIPNPMPEKYVIVAKVKEIKQVAMCGNTMTKKLISLVL